MFQTKERAPVLLCIEVFRPDEMAISIQQKFNKKMIKNLSKQSVNQDLMREKMPDNPYFQKQGPKNGDQNSDSSGNQQNQKKTGGRRKFISEIINHKKKKTVAQQL